MRVKKPIEWKSLGWLRIIGMIGILVGCNSTNEIMEQNNEVTEILQQDVEENGVLADLPEEYKRLTVPHLRQMQITGSEIRKETRLLENESYTSYLAWYESEGLRINGLLTEPKGQMPTDGWPAVVFVHGYIPPRSYQTTQRYEAHVNQLASEGLVVFKIDLRGHGQSQGEPGGAYFSGDYVIDTLSAYESLKKLVGVNQERVGLWGHSMAGNVILRAMAVKPEIPVGIIWAGAVYTYVDMGEYRINDDSYQPGQNPNRNTRGELIARVGDISLDNPYWKLVAPTNFVEELQGRVEIHHARNDDVVRIDYSRNLAQILAEAGADYRIYEYASGGHNIEGTAFGEAMERSVAALKQ